MFWSLTMKIVKYRAHDSAAKCWKWLKDHISLRYFETYPIQVATLEVAKQTILEIHLAEKRNKETYREVGKGKKRGMARKRRRLAESVEVRDKTSWLIGKQGRHLSKTAVWESARRRWCKKALKREWGGSAAKGLDLKFMTLAINGAYPQNQKIRIGTPQYTMNWG